jgi:hypothetical protein
MSVAWNDTTNFNFFVRDHLDTVQQVFKLTHIGRAHSRSVHPATSSFVINWWLPKQPFIAIYKHHFLIECLAMNAGLETLKLSFLSIDCAITTMRVFVKYWKSFASKALTPSKTAYVNAKRDFFARFFFNVNFFCFLMKK